MKQKIVGVEIEGERLEMNATDVAGLGRRRERDG